MSNRQLIVRVEGPTLYDSRVPFRLMAIVLNGIQNTFYYIGLAELGREVRCN